MNQLTLFNQSKEAAQEADLVLQSDIARSQQAAMNLAAINNVAAEIAERDDVIEIQARRIVELEEQLAHQQRINEMLMKRYQQKAAEANTVLKPAEYKKGQEVAFCVKYSSNEKWYEGIVLYVGKGRVKIQYKNERGVIWREPRFMRPIEEMPTHQHTTPYIVDGS